MEASSLKTQDKMNSKASKQIKRKKHMPICNLKFYGSAKNLEACHYKPKVRSEAKCDLSFIGQWRAGSMKLTVFRSKHFPIASFFFFLIMLLFTFKFERIKFKFHAIKSLDLTYRGKKVVHP